MMVNKDNLEFSKLWNSLIVQMHELNVTQMTVSSVLGKFQLQRIKASLEALESLHKSREWLDVDKALHVLLASRMPFAEVVKRYSIPRCPGTYKEEPEIPPVMGSLEAWGALEAVCRRETKIRGKEAIAAIRESLKRGKANDGKSS